MFERGVRRSKGKHTADLVAEVSQWLGGNFVQFCSPFEDLARIGAWKCLSMNDSTRNFLSSRLDRKHPGERIPRD
jgi:hypothetical protein